MPRPILSLSFLFPSNWRTTILPEECESIDSLVESTEPRMSTDLELCSTKWSDEEWGIQSNTPERSLENSVLRWTDSTPRHSMEEKSKSSTRERFISVLANQKQLRPMMIEQFPMTKWKYWPRALRQKQHRPGFSCSSDWVVEKVNRALVQQYSHFHCWGVGSRDCPSVHWMDLAIDWSAHRERRNPVQRRSKWDSIPWHNHECRE